MERESTAYKIRRKMQVVAHKLLPKAFLSKLYYKIVMKEKLNLKDPKTFNEKMQWLKLYYFPNDELAVQCADKYDARKYLIENGYGDKLVPLIGVWNCSSEINWEALPNRFVLKCTHGCAYNIVCSDKSKLDFRQVSKQLDKWLKEDFGAYNVEEHYSRNKHHKIICEEYLGGCIDDFKFFCFNGEPKCLYVSTDLIHDRQAKIGFFNLDGTKMELHRDDYENIDDITFPPFFEEMLAIAKKLCQPFPFVRVDFFLANNTYYFAELTFTPSACMMPFNPKKYDLEWGEMLDISSLKKAK
jgi:hypothetical protein